MSKTYSYSLKDTTSDPGVAANWVDNGAVLDESSYGWVPSGSNHLWAPDANKGSDGKFYLYVPDVPGSNDNSRVGVSVATSPTGPFGLPSGMSSTTNYLPEVSDRSYMSDPSSFIDPKDQQAYLLYADGDFNSSAHGCGHLSIAKLDMATSKLTSNQKVSISGAPNNGSCTPAYIEGGEIGYFGGAGTDGNGKYFLYFAMKESDNTESIAYATGDSVTGPYTYQGMIMSGSGGTGWTNQASIVEWQGHYIMFYHNDPRNGSNPQRQVFLECVGISNGKISSVTRGSYKTLANCPTAMTGMTGTGGSGGAGGTSSGSGGSSSGGTNAGGVTSAGGTNSASGGRSNNSGGAGVAGGNNGGSSSGGSGNSMGGSGNPMGGSGTSTGGNNNARGGTSASAGNASTGGTATNTSSGGGSNNGSGGAATGGTSNNGNGGATANGGSTTSSGGGSDSSSNGCSCRIVDASNASGSGRNFGVVGLGMFAFAWRRRRSAKAKQGA